MQITDEKRQFSLVLNDLIDQSQVDLKALRALVAVADQGSFRAAARSLGYTQSAISHQIATLERSARRAAVHPPGRARRDLADARRRRRLSAGPPGPRRGRDARRRRRRDPARRAPDAADRRLSDGHHRVAARARCAPCASSAPTSRSRCPRSATTPAPSTGSPTASSTSRFVVNPTPDERIQSIPLLDDPWVILTRRDSELAAVETPTFDLLDGVDVVAWNRRWRTQQRARGGVAPARDHVRASSTGPTTTSRCSGWSPPATATPAWTGSAPSGAVEPSLTWLEPEEILIPRTIALCQPAAATRAHRR